MLAHLCLARKLLWGRPVFRSGAWREKEKKEDLIQFSFNGCSHTSASFCLFAIHFFTVVPQEDTKKVLYFRSQSSVTWLSRKRNGCFSSAAKKNVFANIKWYAFTSWKEQLKLLSETFCTVCSFGKLLLRIIRVGFFSKT